MKVLEHVKYTLYTSHKYKSQNVVRLHVALKFLNVRISTVFSQLL